MEHEQYMSWCGVIDVEIYKIASDIIDRLLAIHAQVRTALHNYSFINGQRLNKTK
jgi:hypothetical protein